MGNPAATTLAKVASAANNGAANVDFAMWVGDRKNRRAVPYRMERCGYVPVRNPDRDTGLWVVNGTRQVIYAKASLSVCDRHTAARQLARIGAAQ